MATTPDNGLYMSYSNGKIAENYQFGGDIITSHILQYESLYGRAYNVKQNQHFFMVLSGVTDHEFSPFGKFN